MSTLQEIVAQANEIEQRLIESGGELPPELEVALANMDIAIASKVDGYSVVCAKLEKAEELWADRARAYKALANGLGKTREMIRQRMKDAMEQLGKDEVLGVERRFKLVRGAPALEVDEAKLPDSYKVPVVVIEVDKERIKAELKEGKAIEGASFREVRTLREFANKGDAKR